MRRHIYAITSALFRSCVLGHHDHHHRHQRQSDAAGDGSLVNAQMDAVLCSMALLCTEMSNDDETVVELLRLALAFQLMALENNGAQICCADKLAGVHNLVAKFMHLCSRLLSIPALCQHVQQVIVAREKRAHPSLNIVGGATANTTATAAPPPQTVAAVVDQQQQCQQPVAPAAAAYSPPVGRAPIAHMDSEDNDLAQSSSSPADSSAEGEATSKADEEMTAENTDNGTSPREMGNNNNGRRVNSMDLSGEPSLLFSVETIFKAINASNKYAQNLLQPFKPLPLAQLLSGAVTVGNVYLQQNGGQCKIGGPTTPRPYKSLISAFTPSKNW